MSSGVVWGVFSVVLVFSVGLCPGSDDTTDWGLRGCTLDTRPGRDQAGGINTHTTSLHTYRTSDNMSTTRTTTLIFYILLKIVLNSLIPSAVAFFHWSGSLYSANLISNLHCIISRKQLRFFTQKPKWGWTVREYNIFLPECLVNNRYWYLISNLA